MIFSVWFDLVPLRPIWNSLQTESFPFDSILREPCLGVAHLYVYIVLFETTGPEFPVQGRTECNMRIQLFECCWEWNICDERVCCHFTQGDKKYLHTWPQDISD